MSLLVYVTVTSAVGVRSELGEKLPAGFESWRTLVWGSPWVQALGAEIFPRLASGETLTVDHGELARFQRECALLRENLDAVCADIDLAAQNGTVVGSAPGQLIRASTSREVFRGLVSQRLANIEDAIARAAHAGGAVVIW